MPFTTLTACGFPALEGTDKTPPISSGIRDEEWLMPNGGRMSYFRVDPIFMNGIVIT